MGARKAKISYFYDPEYSGFYYGQDHPMKPQRLSMTHNLILGYGLHQQLDVYHPRRAQYGELCAFHSEEYIDVLRYTTPEQQAQDWNSYLKYGLEYDCPIWHGLFDFCRLYAGASIEGAYQLNHGHSEISINWAGGLHHAKKAEASGFCYVNDCVLGILELLKHHARVLYVDIDIHHGDGVEEAFYTTDRVMCVSFHLHKPDTFFPGTGALEDVGEYEGRGYSVNVPLDTGCTDEQYLGLFKPIMTKVMEVFQPGAVVLQCGADSLVGDRLGALNLTLEGHAEAVRFVKSFGLPMLVLGGGGYTKTTVARAWTMETAVLVGAKLEDALPPNMYLEYFSPEYRLNYNRRKQWDNFNKRTGVERTKQAVLANLSQLQGAPGLAMRERPPDCLIPEWAPSPAGGDEEDAIHGRLTQYVKTHYKHQLWCVEQGLHDPYDVGR